MIEKKTKKNMSQLELIYQTYNLCYEKIFSYKINYKKL